MYASYLDIHLDIDSEDRLRKKHFTIKEMVKYIVAAVNTKLKSPVLVYFLSILCYYKPFKILELQRTTSMIK